MIYLVAPVWMDHVDECRVFTSYSAMEMYVLTHSLQRKTWNADPNWCEVYAFGGDAEMLHPMFRYYIRDGHLTRIPVTRSPSG
jgi:hypothetical protein